MRGMSTHKRLLSVLSTLVVLGAFVAYGAAQAGGKAGDSTTTARAVTAGLTPEQDDDANEADERVTDAAAAKRAADAARARLGDGTVTEVERGDDGAAYEVEVKRADGSFTEVELDRGFDVTAVEQDDD